MSETSPLEWPLLVRGDSMRPLLRPGDAILVRRRGLSQMRLGDLVVALDWAGLKPDYVVHRLWARRRQGQGLKAWTRGDANLWPDRAVAEHAVVGCVVAIGRSGRWMKMGSPVLGLLFSLFSGVFHRVSVWVNGDIEAVLNFLRLRTLRQRAVGFVPELLRKCWSRCLLGPAHTISVDGAQCVVGVLDSDEIWSGRVRILGDVYVPPGVTLRVEPGTSIEFIERSQWSYVSERPAWEGWGAVGDHGKCRLFVAGGFIAEGNAQNHITIGGVAEWGGLHLL